MNKTELIDAMAADAGITKAAAKKALESFLGNVEGSLAFLLDTDHDPNPTKETLPPFLRDPSTFPKKDSNSFFAAKNVVKFKAGAELSKSVN